MKNMQGGRMPPPSDTRETTVAYAVAGMQCSSCVQKIESALRENSGIGKVEIDLAVGEVLIRFDPARAVLDDVEKSLREAGFAVTACRMPNAAGGRHRHAGSPPPEAGPYPYLIGAATALGAIGFYLGFIALTSDWDNARMQFAQYRWWIVGLAAGLGVQVALFSFLRRRLRARKMKAATSGLAASGGMSAASMAACCAHYLVAVLPLLGLSFLSPAVAGLAGHQRELFALGLLSNLFGIGMMLRLMEKSGIVTVR